MKRVYVLVVTLLLMLITASAYAETKQTNDRWVEIENPNKKVEIKVFYDKETVEYDNTTNILTGWIKIDIPDVMREKYKVGDIKRNVYKELNKVQFNTKNKTANIDAEYYGYDKDGNRVLEGKSKKFETIIPGSYIEMWYKTMWGCHQKNKSKKKNNAEDIFKAVLGLPR